MASPLKSPTNKTFPVCPNHKKLRIKKFGSLSDAKRKLKDFGTYKEKGFFSCKNCSADFLDEKAMEKAFWFSKTCTCCFCEDCYDEKAHAVDGLPLPKDHHKFSSYDPSGFWEYLGEHDIGKYILFKTRSIGFYGFTEPTRTQINDQFQMKAKIDGIRVDLSFVENGDEKYFMTLKFDGTDKLMIGEKLIFRRKRAISIRKNVEKKSVTQTFSPGQDWQGTGKKTRLALRQTQAKSAMSATVKRAEATVSSRAIQTQVTQEAAEDSPKLELRNNSQSPKPISAKAKAPKSQVNSRAVKPSMSTVPLGVDVDGHLLDLLKSQKQRIIKEAIKHFNVKPDQQKHVRVLGLENGTAELEVPTECVTQANYDSIMDTIEKQPPFRSLRTFEAKVSLPGDDPEKLKAYKEELKQLMLSIVDDFHEEDHLDLTFASEAVNGEVEVKFHIPAHYHDPNILEKFLEKFENDDRMGALYDPGCIDFEKAEAKVLENLRKDSKGGWDFEKETKDCYALLVGCTYPGTDAELAGPDDDLKFVVKLLQTILNVRFKKLYIGCDLPGLSKSKAWSFFDLTEEHGFQRKDFTFFKPTKENIEKYYKKVLKDEGMSTQQSFTWLHFSGHGTRVKDDSQYSGEDDKSASYSEEDRMDEAIIPCDYLNYPAGKGFIVDDFLSQVLKDSEKSANQNLEIIAIFDCCHSGTMLDLDDSRDDGCFAISLSGCQDDQTSADVQVGRSQFGAFTTALVKVFIDCITKGINPLNVHLDTLEILLNNQLTTMEMQQRNSTTFSKKMLRSFGDIMCVTRPTKVQKLQVNELPPFVPDKIPMAEIQFRSVMTSQSSLNARYSAPKIEKKNKAIIPNFFPEPEVEKPDFPKKFNCPSGHELWRYAKNHYLQSEEVINCSHCSGKKINAKMPYFNCPTCDYTICQNCCNTCFQGHKLTAYPSGKKPQYLGGDEEACIKCQKPKIHSSGVTWSCRNCDHHYCADCHPVCPETTKPVRKKPEKRKIPEKKKEPLEVKISVNYPKTPKKKNSKSPQVRSAPEPKFRGKVEPRRKQPKASGGFFSCCMAPNVELDSPVPAWSKSSNKAKTQPKQPAKKSDKKLSSRKKNRASQELRRSSRGLATEELPETPMASNLPEKTPKKQNLAAVIPKKQNLPAAIPKQKEPKTNGRSKNASSKKPKRSLYDKVGKTVKTPVNNPVKRFKKQNTIRISSESSSCPPGNYVLLKKRKLKKGPEIGSQFIDFLQAGEIVNIDRTVEVGHYVRAHMADNSGWFSMEFKGIGKSGGEVFVAASTGKNSKIQKKRKANH